MNRSAIVFGASGLVGNELAIQLKKEREFSDLTFLLRNELKDKSGKEYVVADFSNEDQLKSLIKADVVFCCLGTTMSQAGSKEAFREVDYSLVLRIAKIAKENHVSRFAVISSIGAKATSRNFYLRVKGEMEEELKKLQFDHLVILRPALLLGDRKEFRFGESVGKYMLKFLHYFLVGSYKKYRPIYAKDVAKSMIKAAFNVNDRITIYESDKLQELADK